MTPVSSSPSVPALVGGVAAGDTDPSSFNGCCPSAPAALIAEPLVVGASTATATLAELTDLARRIRVPAREIKLASAAAEPAQALLALVNGDKLGLTRVKRVSTLITREPAICCHFSYTTLLLF